MLCSNCGEEVSSVHAHYRYAANGEPAGWICGQAGANFEFRFQRLPEQQSMFEDAPQWRDKG